MSYKKNKIIFLIGLLIFQVACSFAKNIPETNDKLRVVIITTGGTIAEKIDPKTEMVVPSISGGDLIKPIAKTMKNINVEVIDFTNIDSSQMTPEIWLKLSKLVNETLKDSNTKGIVITHGTDTMAEGAYFLDLTTNSNKPIIFTGAMHHAAYQLSDGTGNLYNAILQANLAKNYNWGVTINFNQYINSARSARKINTTNNQAFNSGEKGYLGYIAEGKVEFFHDRNRLYIPLPKELPKVILLKTYAGDDGSLLRDAIKMGVKGIVIEGFGAGNVHANLYDTIKEALDKNIAIVMATQVENGSVHPIYGTKGGGLSLAKLGVIFAGDLPGSKARLLLMLALTKVGNNLNDLKNYFSNQYN
jgi:L-asparaginase